MISPITLLKCDHPVQQALNLLVDQINRNLGSGNLSNVDTYEVTLPANPSSRVYRTPIGNYFAAHPDDVKVWHNATLLQYGVDYQPYYAGMFNPSYSQPATVQDVSSGIALTVPVSIGTIRIQWVERTLPVAPRVVGVTKFDDNGGTWERNLTQAWRISDPGSYPNAIYVTTPPDGYELELWRFTNKSGGLHTVGATSRNGHGRRMMPFQRGPQPNVAEPRNAMVMNRAFLSPGFGSTTRRKYRVCWYNPTTRTRSLFAPQLIVFFQNAPGDRHNSNNTVFRVRDSIWIEHC